MLEAWNQRSAVVTGLVGMVSGPLCGTFVENLPKLPNISQNLQNAKSMISNS
jgi:hypothetical protein